MDIFWKGQKSVNFSGAKLMYRDHQGKKFFYFFKYRGFDGTMAPFVINTYISTVYMVPPMCHL
jgi:hypothetical protein